MSNENSLPVIGCVDALFVYIHQVIPTPHPGQNGRHFADDIFRCIFMSEKFCILIKISLEFVP